MTVIEIKLHGAKAMGRVALIDADDYDLVSPYRWRVREKMRPEGHTWGPYAVTMMPAKFPGSTNYGMHSLITGWPLVDHVNGNGLDNRRENLRQATIAQNRHNSRPQAGSSSRFKGVCWDRGVRKWRAAIKVDGKQRYLGIYTSEEDAARAYDAAAREAFGEYAYLNFPAVAS